MMNTYTLTVSEKEMQIIAAGLGELPAKVAVDLIFRLRQEVAEQGKRQSDSATPGQAIPGEAIPGIT